MAQQTPATPATVSPLTNVALTLSALREAAKREHGLPGIVVLHGPSGWGKSTAAAYAAANFRPRDEDRIALGCYFVAIRSVWTRADFLHAVCREMGLTPAGTLGARVDAIAEQLALSGKPLILDEAGELARRAGGPGLIKDLHDTSLGTLLLIGEEGLPDDLKKYERLDGRVLRWLPAHPCTVADAGALARIYAPGVEIAGDLLKHLADKAAGSVRRVAVNLAKVAQEAAKQGWTKVDLATWGDREIYTGKAPARRNV